MAASDPTLISGLSREQVHEQVREDWRIAKDARSEIEDRKRQSYRLYRAWRDDTAGGGKDKDADGPFGWSQIVVPIIYWTVETIMPRLGTQPPTVIAKPLTPEAVKYAHAKSLRIQSDLRRSHAEEQVQLALRTGLVMGDGPMKVPFDAGTKAPTILAIDWWDWFVSPESTLWHQAEVIYHRSWHSARDLERLAAKKDEKDKPLYDPAAIERLRANLIDRGTADESWAERRDVAGLGESGSLTPGTAVVPVTEAWYREGARVVVGGDSAEEILMVQTDETYVWRTPKDQHPYRPFSCFTPNPDLFMPYGISVAEMLEGHQNELSILRNQYIDQLSASIFAPLGYDARKVRPEDIARAWSSPGGMFASEGPPGEAVARFTPGSMTRDFVEAYSQIRSEVQLISGASDYGAGLTSAAGVDNQTATGLSLIVSEGNKRYQGILKQLELAMQRIACQFDYLDRTLNSRSKFVPVEPGYTAPEDAQGITAHGGVVEISGAVNGPEALYDIEIDVGAMAPPQSNEQARNTLALVQALSMMPPSVQQEINWSQILRTVIETHGQSADRILQPPPDPMQSLMQGMAGQGQGEIPVGPAVPIG